jgi:SAM-dependent methyltransferase
MKRQIKMVLGKLVAIKPIHDFIRRLFILGNKELYRKSLTQSPVLKYSTNQDWVRAPMYSAIYQFFEKFSKRENLKDKIAIEIGGSEGSIKNILEKFGVNYKVAPNFPEVDIYHLPYNDNSLDFLIADQVFEHLEKPWVAVKEIYRVLKPGGIVIVTTPFMIAVHEEKDCKDYYRYTPRGLKSLFSKFEILEADGWGNREIVNLSVDPSVGGIMVGVNIPVSEILKKQLLDKNDNKHYLVTWCIAKKSL